MREETQTFGIIQVEPHADGWRVFVKAEGHNSLEGAWSFIAQSTGATIEEAIGYLWTRYHKEVRKAIILQRDWPKHPEPLDVDKFNKSFRIP